MPLPSGSLAGLAHYLHRGRPFGKTLYKALVLLLTFLTYAAFHATRKPPSIVKSVMHGDAERRELLAYTHLYSGPEPSALRRLMQVDPRYSAEGGNVAIQEGLRQPIRLGDALPKARLARRHSFFR